MQNFILEEESAVGFARSAYARQDLQVPGNIRRAEHFVHFLRRLLEHMRRRMEVQVVHQESPRTFLDRLQAEVGIDGSLPSLSSPFKCDMPCSGSINCRRTWSDLPTESIYPAIQPLEILFGPLLFVALQKARSCCPLVCSISIAKIAVTERARYSHRTLNIEH